MQKGSSPSTSSPILHKHYNKYAWIIVLHMHAKIFLVYIYPKMTESETCITYFHWNLLEGFLEFFLFTLFPHILAKLICIILSNLCQSDEYKMVYHLCFNFLFICLLVRSSISSLFTSSLDFSCFKLPIHIFYLLFHTVSRFIFADLLELVVYSSFNAL